MARFSQKDIFFKDGDMAVFGTGQDSQLFWDGVANEMCLTTTISGVDPTEDYHLTTKYYVDQQLSTSSGVELVQFSSGALQLDGATPPAYTDVGVIGALLFDPTIDESVYGSFKIPPAYKNNTNISVEIQYMNATGQAGVNSCVWALDYHSYADGETYGSKTTTAISVTDALPNGANAGTFQETNMTMSYNDVNNPLVAGDTVTFRFYRDANNGSDTMTGDGALLVLVFRIEWEGV